MVVRVAAVGVAVCAALWPAMTLAEPGVGWELTVNRGFSEAVASGDRGARLVLACATSSGALQPSYTVRVEGFAHQGRPLKAQLTVGPTHLTLALQPTSAPTTSMWNARSAKEQRAYRALAARIRSANAPLKLKLEGAGAETFSVDGAKAALNAQALQCRA